MLRPAALGILVSVVFGSGVAWAQNATTPGAVTLPYPTTQALSIEWAITGDANADGVVTVRYRETGAADWRIGMPLLRVPAGSNDTGDFGSGGGQWSNKHAGSLFDLDPGKSYEVELTLTDPDGGSKTVTATGATRPIPVAPADAKSKAVTPSTFAAALSSAAAGDLLLLGPGTYAPFTMERSGAANRPIVIRGESADTVVFSAGRLTLSDISWVYLENLGVQGEIRMSGSSNMVVRGCKINSKSSGITFQVGDEVPRNNFIVDNDVVGAANWTNEQLGADGFNGGEGIELTGSGHVVCFNHIKGFRDDISLMEYDEAYEQVSIDICNNDIEQATDDGIEGDSGMGNVRIVRNRIRNCFDGCSSQPTLGGPNYYIRNVMYNVLYSPFKFHNGTVGDVVLHNTVVKCGDAYGCYAGETWSRAYFRNNIFIGGAGGGTFGGYANGTGRIFQLADADATCSFDYDGVGAIGITTFSGKIGSKSFTSLATLQSNTSEVHAVQVDMSIFATAVNFPSAPFPPKDAVDLRLAATGAAVDKGLPITGINDGFAGAAPDLGAYEAGQALPVYGPRGNPGTGGAGGSTGTTPTGGATGTTPTGGTTGTTAPAAGAGGTSTAPTGGRTSTRAGGTTSITTALMGGTIAPVGGTTAAAPLAGTTAIVPTGGVVATGGAPGTGIVVPDAGSIDTTAKSGKSGCSCNLASAASHPLASALVIAMLFLRRRRGRKSGS
jgi:hypothetical protein